MLARVGGSWLKILIRNSPSHDILVGVWGFWLNIIIRNSPSHDMLARVGGVPWDSLLSFPMDWEAGLKCAQVEQLSSYFSEFFFKWRLSKIPLKSPLYLVWSLPFWQNFFIALHCILCWGGKLLLKITFTDIWFFLQKLNIFKLLGKSQQKQNISRLLRRLSCRCCSPGEPQYKEINLESYRYVDALAPLIFGPFGITCLICKSDKSFRRAELTESMEAEEAEKGLVSDNPVTN